MKRPRNFASELESKAKRPRKAEPEINEASLPRAEVVITSVGGGKTPKDAALVALERLRLNGAEPIEPVSVKFSLGSPRGIPSTWLAQVRGQLIVGKLNKGA